MVWLVNPAGERTLSLGVNHVEPKLMLMPYNREQTLARYGQDFVSGQEFNPAGAGARKFTQGVLANLSDWGFNTLGYHTTLPSSLFRTAVAYCPLARPISLSRLDAEFVDVFAADVAARIDTGIRAIVEPARDEPNILGWYFNDVPPYDPALSHRISAVHPWVQTLLALPAGSPGKATLIDVLKTRYASASEAAQACGQSASSWEGLAAITEWSRLLAADEEALLSKIVDRWYALQCDAVRRYDPNHLILGDKISIGSVRAGPGATGGLPSYLLPILAKYVDVVTIQWYGYFPDQAATLRSIHAATGKPILLGDSSFAAIQPRQNGQSKGVIVDSEAEVGKAFAEYLQAALAEPYIIGWHFCGYVESYAGPNGRMQPQCGFIDPFEVPHEEALSQVRAANAAATRWHG